MDFLTVRWTWRRWIGPGREDGWIARLQAANCNAWAFTQRPARSRILLEAYVESRAAAANALSGSSGAGSARPIPARGSSPGRRPRRESGASWRSSMTRCAAARRRPCRDCIFRTEWPLGAVNTRRRGCFCKPWPPVMIGAVLLAAPPCLTSERAAGFSP